MVMLGQGCFRVLFWRTIYFRLKSGFKMGFCQWAEMGPKVGFAPKVGQKWVKTHFSPTLNTSRGF